MTPAPDLLGERIGDVLKPCPICDGTAMAWTRGTWPLKNHEIRCSVCGLRTHRSDDLSEVVAFWNRPRKGRSTPDTGGEAREAANRILPQPDRPFLLWSERAELVERTGSFGRDLLSRIDTLAADAIIVARALLTFPRRERDDVIEECAKAVESETYRDENGERAAEIIRALKSPRKE